MKKILAISMVIIGVTALLNGQVTPTVQNELVTIKATLSPETSGGLVSSSKISRGTIMVRGTNVVISGMATIVLPSSHVPSLIDTTSAGVQVSNLVNGSFVLTTNGSTEITATFKK